jgi:hypothetical protein
MPKKKIEDTTPISPKPAGEDSASIRFKKGLFKEPATPVDTTPKARIIEDVEVEPDVKAKKPRRGKWVLFGILAMLLLTAIGAGIGYASGIKQRQLADNTRRLKDAVTQFELGRQDLLAGKVELAQQRFIHVLTVYPQYPGIEEALKEAMVAVALNQGQPSATEATPLPNVTPVATKDTREMSVLLQQGKDQLNASDWSGLLTTVNSMRNIDPTYEPIIVDGLYYFALRNEGIKQVEGGNLEVGLYDFALASQIAPIDEFAEARRGWAKLYINGASWWEVNWQNASLVFSQLYSMVPELRDSSGVSVVKRYAGSLDGYGDFLQSSGAWCEAVVQYEASIQVFSTQAVLDKLPQAREFCANPPVPTPTPTPTIGPNSPTPTPTNAPENTP